MTYSIYGDDGNVLEGFVTREGEIYLTVMEDMNLSSAASLKVTIHELMKFTAHLRNDYEEQSKSNE